MLAGTALGEPLQDPVEEPAPVEEAAPVEETVPAEEPAPVEETQREAPPVEDQAALEEPAPAWLDRLREIPIHGLWSNQYRARWTSDDSDHDVRSWLSLDIGDAEKHEYTGRFDGILYWDVDGRSGEDGQSTFFEITDTYDSRTDGRLYEAYVDAHWDSLSVARLGRQQILETPVLAWFDGALVETQETTDYDLFFGAYGGIPVHVFESSPSGDAIFGVYAAGRPWKGGKLRFDYMRLQDENVFGDEDNDLFNLGWWQSLSEGFFAEAEYSRLDESSRDVRARATYYDTESDFTLQASYYELLQTQGNLALEIDPFFGSLLELFPYYQTRFLASKSFWEWIYLEGGFDVRRVDDDDDIGQFNRDFERYYFVTTFQDVWLEDLDFTLNGDVYDSDGNDTEAWGLDATKRFDEQWQGSLGTFYSLFKYDYFTAEERDHVRTFYLKVEYDRTKNMGFDLHYEFEDDDFDDYQTLRLGMSWRF